MKSHEFEFRLRDLARVFVPVTVAILGLITLLRVLDELDLLPPRAIFVDPPETMLLHQSCASRLASPAEIALTGDSTCLVGVDARELSSYLPGKMRAQNLSLIISFGLNVYGKLISDFVAANHGRVRNVVLLVCTSKLTTSGSPDGAMDLWREMNHPRKDSLGIYVLRHNLLGWVLDTPLRGRGAEFFAFSSQIDAYQKAHDGSLIDLGRFVQRARVAGAPEVSNLTLTDQIKLESRAFRQAVPAGVKLFIGLTPQASGSSPSVTTADRDRLLREWNQFIQADVLLTNLVFVLPNGCFSSTAHLNREGQRQFTASLGRELAPFLDRK